MRQRCQMTFVFPTIVKSRLLGDVTPMCHWECDENIQQNTFSLSSPSLRFFQGTIPLLVPHHRVQRPTSEAFRDRQPQAEIPQSENQITEFTYTKGKEKYRIHYRSFVKRPWLAINLEQTCTRITSGSVQRYEYVCFCASIP